MNLNALHAIRCIPNMSLTSPLLGIVHCCSDQCPLSPHCFSLSLAFILSTPTQTWLPFKVKPQFLEPRRYSVSCFWIWILCLVSANTPHCSSQHFVLWRPPGDHWPDDQWEPDILHYLWICPWRLHGGKFHPSESIYVPVLRELK